MRGRSVTRAASLAGDLGDLFWSLGPSVSHPAGGEIFARIYVANVTDDDNQYMLLATVTRGGSKITEFPIRVDGSTWFTVGANSTVRIPSSMEVAYTDVTLTLELYERVSNEATDSVSTALVGYLPAFPGGPGTAIPDLMSSLIMMMMVIMMMNMIMKTMKKKENEK